MISQESLDRGRIAFAEIAESPRKRLDDHIVSVVHQKYTNSQGAPGVTPTAQCFPIERDGADQCCPAPPTIFGLRPFVNERIGDLAFPPSRTRQVAGERIHGAPGIESASEAFQIPLVQTGEGRAVFVYQLVSHETAIEPRSRFYQTVGNGENELAGFPPQSRGELAPDTAEIWGVPHSQGEQPCSNFVR